MASFLYFEQDIVSAFLNAIQTTKRKSLQKKIDNLFLFMILFHILINVNIHKSCSVI